MLALHAHKYVYTYIHMCAYILVCVGTSFIIDCRHFQVEFRRFGAYIHTFIHTYMHTTLVFEWFASAYLHMCICLLPMNC